MAHLPMPISSRFYPAPSVRRCRVVTGRTAEGSHAFQRPDQQRGTRYRTRMAEAVCLFRHQRQWFRNQPLQQARTLVADYRFVRRPRNYPKRELPAQTVLSKWVDVPWMNEIKRRALSRLIGDFFIAGFQERSTERILRAWHFHSHHARVKEATGTIVCAGTGSGKTLAFYLPALTSLLNDIQRDNAQRVRTLALYPRKELLKDQFMETGVNVVNLIIRP